MDDLKDAVGLAQDYLAALIPDAKEPALEEVEQADDAWLITLSFVRPGMGPLGALQPRRTYKQFRVVEGRVVSMKIRELSGA